MNDDLEAIRRVLTGDVESFRHLVERYQRPLLALCRNLTPPDTDHEGVAQDVFLAAFRRLAWFDPKRAAFSTWLFTIARNHCRNELARRRPVVAAELPEVADLRTPDRVASEAELSPARRRPRCPAVRAAVRIRAHAAARSILRGRQSHRRRRRGHCKVANRKGP